MRDAGHPTQEKAKSQVTEPDARLQSMLPPLLTYPIVLPPTSQSASSPEQAHSNIVHTLQNTDAN